LITFRALQVKMRVRKDREWAVPVCCILQFTDQASTLRNTSKNLAQRKEEYVAAVVAAAVTDINRSDKSPGADEK